MAKSVKLKESDTYIATEGVYDFESKMTQEEINALFVNAGAGTHNSIYRGKFLGTSVTPEQYKAISDGTFEGLYIGDFWTINGVNWRNAFFDPFLNCGDTPLKKHHSLILPDTCLYNANMNPTDVTTGGYAGSAMHTSNLAQAKTMINEAFGSHVLTRRELLSSAVNGNVPSSYAWYDSDVELMNERQAFGSEIWGANGGRGNNVGVGDGQFPLFMFDRSKLHNLSDYWLRDVAAAPGFVFVSALGFAESSGSSNSKGVRPYFCIG